MPIPGHGLTGPTGSYTPVEVRGQGTWPVLGWIGAVTRDPESDLPQFFEAYSAIPLKFSGRIYGRIQGNFRVSAVTAVKAGQGGG